MPSVGILPDLPGPQHFSSRLNYCDRVSFRWPSPELPWETPAGNDGSPINMLQSAEPTRNVKATFSRAVLTAFQIVNFLDPVFMASTVERCREPRVNNFLRH
jgi:hypothetical protein